MAESEAARGRRQENLTDQLGDVILPAYRTLTPNTYRVRIGEDAEKLRALEVTITYAHQGFVIDGAGEARYGLALLGEVGTGKTGLAMLAAREFLGRGKAVAVVEFYHWLGKLGTLGYDESEGQIQTATSADLLVVDDIGNVDRRTESGDLLPETARRIEVLTRMINHRTAHLLPFVLTSNLDADGLATQLGMRLASRILGACTVVWVGGRDLRLG